MTLPWVGSGCETLWVCIVFVAMLLEEIFFFRSPFFGRRGGGVTPDALEKKLPNPRDF